MALTELGRVYQGKGDPAKSEEAFKRALEADENYTRPTTSTPRCSARTASRADKVRMLAQEYLRRRAEGRATPPTRSGWPPEGSSGG